MSFGLDFALRLLRDIDPLIEQATAMAAAGAPATDADYRRLVGRIQGLREARSLIIAPFGPDAELPRAP